MAESSELPRSAAVREALKTWIRREQVEDFEDARIARLKQRESDEDADERAESDAWLAADSWGDE